MSKLIVVISGRKASGKDTYANMFAAEVYNLLHPGGETKMLVQPDGTLWYQPVGATAYRHIPLRGPGSEPFCKVAGIKIVAFADALKQLCMDLFGLTYQQAYGSNADKETLTNILWDNFPLSVRWKCRLKWWHLPRSGPMTARSVLQVVGTETVRTIYWNAWADALYRVASRAEQDVVIVPDCRFPNEKLRDVMVPKDIRVVHGRLFRCPHPGDKHPSETSMDHMGPGDFDFYLPAHATLADMLLSAEYMAKTLLHDVGIRHVVDGRAVIRPPHSMDGFGDGPSSEREQQAQDQQEGRL